MAEQALRDAAGRGDEVRVQQLLAKGVDVNADDTSKWTALHHASSNGHTGIVQALLTAGATVDPRTLMNQTPLHKAAENDHPECVRALLRAGASTIIRDWTVNKKSAEELAVQEDVLKVFQLFKDLHPKVVNGGLTIDLSGKGLTSVPAEVFDATDIERLDLSHNRLTSIPEEIGQLQKLRELKLDNNLLTQLPQAITTLPNLQHIDVSVNKLETLPDGISRLQLHELYLENNRFKEIPEEVCSLLQLNTFSVGDNPLKCLPDKISQLTGLRTMYMDRCQFDEFPRQVLQLEGLEELYMGDWAGEGKPSPVPEDVGRLKKLHVLDLRNSGLESLPDGVGELEQLTYLGISGNRFTSVPEQIMMLSNIGKLILSDNKISRLPLNLSRLAQLEDMKITGNPLTYPPPDVRKKGTAAIMDFLRRDLKDKEERELRKLFHRFSQSVTEPSEVEDLGGALGLTADYMINVQASRNTKPSSQAYKVLSKWMETDREASMDKLEKDLSESGMGQLAEKVNRIQSQPAKRPADTSGGPPTKRRAAGGPSSVDSEDKLTQLQGENRALKAQVQKLQSNQKPRSRGQTDKPVVLLLNDEYGIRKGGISTINREIGCLLASKGAEVLCTVLNAAQQDKDDAAADGIRLIFPATFERDPRKPELHWLTFDHQTRYPDLPSHVDFIVGHVHITSHAARRIKDRFPGAKLVQVTHVMPEDTSHYKGVERVLSIGKESDNILDDLRHADVIFSVGPLMYDYYKHQTKQLKRPHHELLPKPSDIFINLHPEPPVGTETKVVLSIGRVKGVERLKGFDLAAKSMWDVMKELANTKWRLRGVTKEDFRGSQEIINNDKVEFVPFTPLEYGTQEELRDDMGRADVVLMPSRAEPFGLVGLEAIAAGVPVVISHKSGLAKFLKTQDPEFDRTIVEIGDDDDKAAKTLSKRIIDILKDGPREFRAAQSLKKKLLDSKYWTESHTNVLQTFGLEG